MTNKEAENSRLRICLVGPAWPYRGGISHYNTCLARELGKRHEVAVVNFSRLYPGFLFPGRTQYDESDGALRVQSRRLIDSLNPFSWVRAGLCIARMRPRLTVVQWWHPYFAPALATICALLRLFSRTRIVFICHNVVPHETAPLDRLLAAAAFALPHGFIVQSSQDRDNLLGIRKRATLLVHPLPIFDFFRTQDLSRERARRLIGEGAGPLLLFFGYIRPYKGLRFLIEALPRIVSATGARLLVVGEFYEDAAPYRELVRRLGVEERVRFIDRYVGNDEVAGFFAAADLVVLPYVSATQSGIAQIALAFDRPAIVTRVGGLPEVVSEGRTGFIVEAADAEAISEAAVRFFREDWGGRMAPRFAAEKERFSWAALTRALMELGVRIA